MAIAILFDKARAEYFLSCLAQGKPINPQDPNGWTVGDMLALAGACHYSALSHGPAQYRKGDPSGLPAERREAVEESFYEDLDAAVGWYSQVTILVREGEYDNHFELRHRAVVQKSEGKITVQLVDGHKGKE